MRASTFELETRRFSVRVFDQPDPKVTMLYRLNAKTRHVSVFAILTGTLLVNRKAYCSDDMISGGTVFFSRVSDWQLLSKTCHKVRERRKRGESFEILI